MKNSGLAGSPQGIPSHDPFHSNHGSGKGILRGIPQFASMFIKNEMT